MQLRIIDCSTILPKVAMGLNPSRNNHGITFADAPVSGGVTGAAARALKFMLS